MVKFCGKKKKEPLCFVTKMVEKGENKQTYGDEIGIVQNINLWMKLISTLNVSVKEKIIQTKFLFLELTMFADLLLNQEIYYLDAPIIKLIKEFWVSKS